MTAAQFLTLSLGPCVATDIGLGDLDGPGHVPIQLYVRPIGPNTMKADPSLSWILPLLSMFIAFAISQKIPNAHHAFMVALIITSVGSTIGILISIIVLLDNSSSLRFRKHAKIGMALCMCLLLLKWGPIANSFIKEITAEPLKYRSQ